MAKWTECVRTLMIAWPTQHNTYTQTRAREVMWDRHTNSDTM